MYLHARQGPEIPWSSGPLISPVPEILAVDLQSLGQFNCDHFKGATALSNRLL